MSFPLDHIAIACTDLAAGEAWLTARLGAAPDGGGAHPLMGTHNRLWRLGPADYLELIAIDPAAPAPFRPRWFGLDGFSGPPQVAGWVVQAPDATPAPPGSRWETASRGALSWRITIADSGVTAAGGTAPALIDWQGAPHPATRLPDRGLRLVRLTLTHPDAPATEAAQPDPVQPEATQPDAGPATARPAAAPVLAAGAASATQSDSLTAGIDALIALTRADARIARRRGPCAMTVTIDTLAGEVTL